MKIFYSFLLIACILFQKVSAQPIISYESKISGLTQPVDIVNAGDGTGRIFVVQQGGVIRVYNSSFAYLGDFLTVTGINVGGEEGLLSMAFHPDYENPDPLLGGFFYVYYTNNSGNLELARYHVSANPNVADVASKVIVLTIPHPGQSNHNGAKLNFGNDGYLYFGTGDGGGGGDIPNNAQNGSSLLGKMLRIAVNTSPTAPYYTIPPGNPYVGGHPNADEIWGMGLRNPWRWSFDRLTGDMWIADVGQSAREEVNFNAAPLTGGANYGWRCYEGFQPYNTAGCLPASSYQAPIFDYPRNSATGGFSVTGGHVYRGTEFPSLYGYYVMADYVSGNQWKIRQTGPNSFNVYLQSSTGLPPNIAGFGEAENGTLFAASRSQGIVYKMIVTGVLPAKLIEFTGNSENNINKLQWTTAAEDNLLEFIIEYSEDGIRFQQLGTINATGNPAGSVYNFDHNLIQLGRAFYRLKMIERDRSFSYSQIIVITKNNDAGNFVFPTVINNGQLNIYPQRKFEVVQLLNMSGSVVLTQELNGQTGRVTVPVQSLAAGTYLVVMRDGRTIITQKVIIHK